MRVLITGGAGFIGSHLSDHFLGRGDEVWILDDLSTGSVENIEHLRRHSHFFFHRRLSINGRDILRGTPRSTIHFLGLRFVSH